MAHIQLPDGLPGIRGPMAFSPETARPLNALANALLRPDDDAGLSWGDRDRTADAVDRHLCFIRKQLLFLPDYPRGRGQ